MVTLEVYTRNIKIKYKAFLLSKATFIALCSELVSIILPFILSYETGGFWQKRDVVYEQPNVKFVGDFIFLATTNDDQQPVFCSSFSHYNADMKSLDKCSAIKIRESDDNHDGKADYLHLMISAKLSKKIRVTSFQLILPLNYSLSTPCDFHTQSAIIYQQPILNSASQVSVYGDLGLRQTEALKCTKYGTAMNIGHTTIIDEDVDFQRFSLENIIARYAGRKIKTSLNNVLTTFNPINDSTFTVKLEVKYPEHKIYFKPRLWQIIKFAWVQYIAIYIVVSWIISRMKIYIFGNNLVLLYEDRTEINKC